VPQLQIRFGVSDADGRRSATWVCTTRTGQGKADVYLACRNLSGAAKLSLHQSGEWRFAFAKEQFDSLFDEESVPTSRLIASWFKPPETLKGITRACTIFVPAAAVSTESAREDDVTWLPAPTQGLTKEIALLLIEPGATLPAWLTEQVQVKTVGVLTLDNGGFAWLVHRDVLVPPQTMPTQVVPNFFRGKSESDLKTEQLRGLIVGDASDGSIALYEAAVRVERTAPK
jgi:hypothetical protein